MERTVQEVKDSSLLLRGLRLSLVRQSRLGRVLRSPLAQVLRREQVARLAVVATFGSSIWHE